MEEKTFFEYGDVKVTNARFITGAQTFAMSNVTSVKAHTVKPNRLIWILLVLIGLGVSSQNPAAGIGMVVVGMAVMYFQKTTYHVMLSTSGGETSALKTYQLDYITQIVAALNNAIVHRG